MEIYSYGVNLDQGLPLSEPEEFDNFYIPFQESSESILKEWFDSGTNPIILAGQIGAGKTTIINHILLGHNKSDYILCKFDSKVVDTSLGGFLWHLISETATYCEENQFGLDEHSFLIDLIPSTSLSWQEIIRLNHSQFKTIADYELVWEIIRKLSNKKQYVVQNLIDIFNKIEQKFNKRLVLFFSGIDKFQLSSASYFAIKELIIEFLQLKLLLEFNAVHFFDQRWVPIQKVFLGTVHKSQLIQLMDRRMGSYKFILAPIVSDLIAYSGGNIRQSLRLLSNYNVFRKRSVSNREALSKAVIQTITDLFSTANWPEPSFMKFVRKSKTISAQTITTVGDPDTAQLSVFDNWIFLTGTQADGSWEVKINPLVSLFYKESFEPLDVTIAMASQIGIENDMSSDGLILPGSRLENKSGILSTPVKLNFEQAWNVLAASVLSLQRNDRTIIVYESIHIKDLTQSLIRLRLEFDGVIKYIEKGFDDNQLIAQELQNIYSTKPDQATLISIDFRTKLSPEQLLAIDALRDIFLPYKMIWWIDKKVIHEFLVNWRSLRQLFNVVYLEDELKNLLTKEEIKSDLMLASTISNKSEELKKSIRILKKFMRNYYE